jgi:hypothetical protein
VLTALVYGPAGQRLGTLTVARVDRRAHRGPHNDYEAVLTDERRGRTLGRFAVSAAVAAEVKGHDREDGPFELVARAMAACAERMRPARPGREGRSDGNGEA